MKPGQSDIVCPNCD